MSRSRPEARAAQAIQALAEDVSGRVLEDWAAKLPDRPPTPEEMGRYLIPWAASARPRVRAFLDQWAADFPTVTGSAVALGIAAHLIREPQPVEITWSGPMPAGSTLRRTEQVLLEMIETAQRSLWIITYSAYDVADVKEALQAAVKRGVDVRFLLETQEDGALKGDPQKALGLDDHATVYVWPRDQRPEINGQRGVLHAKAVIKDEAELLITSANLTGNAMHLNMEIGAIDPGASSARAVVGQVHGLVAEGSLRRLGSVKK
jgi:phosphatidylserine/phosphatidylglycerophosphate/cardiolipin synthase-like enzyme